jgi:hypothetical protein
VGEFLPERRRINGDIDEFLEPVVTDLHGA